MHTHTHSAHVYIFDPSPVCALNGLALSQTEFQGWFVGDWSFAFCRKFYHRKSIGTAPYIAFRLCGLDYICTPCFDGFAVLRPKRSGFRISPTGVGAGKSEMKLWLLPLL